MVIESKWEFKLHLNISAEKAQKAHEEWLKQKEEESKKIAEKQKKLQAKKTKSEQDKENKEIEKRQKAEEKYKLWLEGKDAIFCCTVATAPFCKGMHNLLCSIRLEIHLFEAKESERKRAAAKIKKQKEAENKKLEEKRKINDEKFKEWLK